METTRLILEMCNQDIANEVEALSAILCADREFQVQSTSENELVLIINPHQIKNHSITITVILDIESYPISSPQLSVQVPQDFYGCTSEVCNNLVIASIQSPKLSRVELQILDTLVNEEANKLRGQVSILSLVEWLVRYSTRYEEETTPASESLTERDVDNEYTTVAQLDHIRSKTIYFKTLSQWFRELDLQGVLVSYRRWIFLMVSGNKNNLQVLWVIHTQV